MAFFFPLQGFWNALIYKRPQWLHNRKRRNQSRKSHQQSQRSSGSKSPPVSRLSFSKKSKGDKVSFVGNSTPLSTHTKYSMGSASQNYHDEEGGANNLNGSKSPLDTTDVIDYDSSYKSQLDATAITIETDDNEDKEEQQAKNNIPREQAPEIDLVVKYVNEEDPEAGNIIVANHADDDDSVALEEILDYQVPLKWKAKQDTLLKSIVNY